jgi:V-type H+-transporting ATPase subunit H
MVVAKLFQFTKALSGRKWTDQEIQEDLSFLQEELQASFDQLTYYPSGIHLISVHSMNMHLNWSRVISHGHPLIAMNSSGKKMLVNSQSKIISYSKYLRGYWLLQRILLSLLLAVTMLANSSSRFHKLESDHVVDFANYRQIQSLGTKTRIMELMGHNDSDVRYEALSTVQLLMSGQFL